MADTKLGKGGYGEQPIDKHGKYLSDSGWSGEDYIQEFFNENPEMKEAYDNAPDELKKEIIEMVKSMLDEDATEQRMSEKFRPSTDQDFDEWGVDCLQKLNSEYGEATAQELLSGFYSGYMGAGQRSFNFNTAVRLGYQKAYQLWVDRGMIGAFPTEDEVNERIGKLDKLCNSYTIKENIEGHRFVDENWLCSMCGDLLKSDYKITKDPYGYDTISRDEDLDKLADFLKNNGLVGTTMDGDSAFTSVSLGTRTHMGKHVDPEKVKRIKIVYNLPKGQNMFVSQYQRENECMLPRKMKFFVQDIGTVDDDVNGTIVKRLVMTLGIR